MKRLTMWLVLLLSIPALAINKQDFDIAEGLSKASPHAFQVYSYGNTLYRGPNIEMSLLSGGYFSIGNITGSPNTDFDDHTTITYGHPYAMTSFPMLNIDGTWGRFDELHTELFDMIPKKHNDTLSLSFLHQEKFLVSFSMHTTQTGTGVHLAISVENLDSLAHNLGGGLVIDPSLSRYGDGQVYHSTIPLTGPGSVENIITNPVLEVWERNASPRGMGMQLTINDTPSTVNVGNWDRIWQEPFAEILDKYLYDTAVQILWNATDIGAGDTLQCSMDLELLEPEFDSELFLRWDCPAQLTLSDNVLFPHTLKTTIEGLSTVEYVTAPELDLLLDNPYELYGNGEIYNWTLTGRHSFRSLNLTTREIYKEKIVKIRLIAMQGSTVMDSLSRYVKIPATPVSNEGLIISIDSLITPDFPDMQVVFGGEVEETGQKLLDLNPENIFLYENDQLIELFDMEKYTGGGSTLADVIFVLDVSGSMGDEIAAVRDNLGEFADSLIARGYDFKIGVVTFSTTVDLVIDLTDDVDYVKQQLSQISLWGGVEDSPSALYRASQLSLREGSKRNIIWITDEPYPEDNYTQEDIVNRMLLTNITVHGVGTTHLQTNWFNPIVNPTGGKFFNITGNFRDIMLEVSRLESQDLYALSYTSTADGAGPIDIELEVHYAGLGGLADTTFTPGAQMLQKNDRLACYPNPFNPEITLQVQLDAYEQGVVDIYNILGQRVRHFEMTQLSQPHITWNATNEQGQPVSAGMYIVQFTRMASDGSPIRETSKIMYLK